MNKHMLPLANKPMLYHCIENLLQAGIKEIGVVIGPFGTEIQERLKDGFTFGVNVSYIHQGNPRGLADAVMLARDFIGDAPFVLHLGDNVFENGVRSFVTSYEKEPSDCLLGVIEVGHPERFGVVEVVNGNPVAFLEKPRHSNSNLAIVGAYVFGPTVFETIQKLEPSPRGEMEITDAIETMRKSGKRIKIHRFVGWWKDAGTPEDLLEANRLLLMKQVQGKAVQFHSVKMDRNAFIGPRTIVMEGSEIVGPVVIGGDCSVGPNCRIGPNVSIGDHTLVSRATISDSIIMENCFIGDGVRLRSSILMRRCRVTDNSSELTCVLAEGSNIEKSFLDNGRLDGRLSTATNYPNHDELNSS